MSQLAPLLTTAFILQTDKTGATSVAIRLPEKSGDSLIFHYNLKFFDSEENTINGLSLKRFVMQSVSNGVSFLDLFVLSDDRYIDFILLPGGDIPSACTVYSTVTVGCICQQCLVGSLLNWTTNQV